MLNSEKRRPTTLMVTSRAKWRLSTVLPVDATPVIYGTERYIAARSLTLHFAGLNCEYRFVGKPGQRIRLEFRDFDLFMGGHQ